MIAIASYELFWWNTVSLEDSQKEMSMESYALHKAGIYCALSIAWARRGGGGYRKKNLTWIAAMQMFKIHTSGLSSQQMNLGRMFCWVRLKLGNIVGHSVFFSLTFLIWTQEPLGLWKLWISDLQGNPILHADFAHKIQGSRRKVLPVVQSEVFQLISPRY